MAAGRFPSPGAFPVAAAAARIVEQHLAEHMAAVRERETPTPGAADVEEVIAAGFWASLRREEGYAPRISMAFLPPGHAPVRLMLESPLPLAPEPLTRLAPAVERPGIHLGVWRMDGRMQVWGATQSLPAFCLVLEVVAPGLLVVKHSRAAAASGKFANLAVLEGDQIKVLDKEAATWPDTPSVLRTLLGLDSPQDGTNVVVRLALSMRAHKHGATLLLVPAATKAWRGSIVSPIRYAVVPPFSRLGDVVRDASAGSRTRRWEEALGIAVDAVAGLTAVDGAAVMTDQYDLLAFGATIRMRDSSTEVSRLIDTEPVRGSAPRIVQPSAVGGTRHLSAAQFAHDQRDAVAFVASQDGRFTVFAWSTEQSMVRAHRIEALLL